MTIEPQLYQDSPAHEVAMNGIPVRGPRAMRAFAELRDTVIREWTFRSSDGIARTPQDSPLGYMKRQSYRIISHYVEAGATRFFEHAVRYEGRGLPSNVKLDDNPFHYGLLALFSDDRLLSRQDRSYFSQQMLYAHRHHVSPELLVGFLYQVGSNVVLRRKIKEHYVEAGFFITAPQ